jgi:hypothetical protein
MLWLKIGMDINQIIELWRGLSPHLVGAIPDQELPKDERTEEENNDNDGNGENKTVGPIGSHHE